MSREDRGRNRKFYEVLILMILSGTLVAIIIFSLVGLPQGNSSKFSVSVFFLVWGAIFPGLVILFTLFLIFYLFKSSSNKGLMGSDRYYGLKKRKRSTEEPQVIEETGWVNQDGVLLPHVIEVPADRLEKKAGVAFCPNCREVVQIKSGACIYCGKPVITE